MSYAIIRGFAWPFWRPLGGRVWWRQRQQSHCDQYAAMFRSELPTQGPPSQGTVASLCPATADIGNTTYLGGAGSGEVVNLNINATAMTYTLTWFESPIPLATGTVSPTRVGVQITGPVAHPPTGALPTAEQIRCAFILEPGTGSGPNGTYSTSANFNAANPPTIFVGLGVAGGGIPGATVQFSGVLTGIGAVDNRHFDFYPFLAFANTTTDITKLPGTYNGLLYHLTPSGNSGNYATVGTSTIETFDSTGACTSTQSTSGFSPNAGGCLTTGNPYTLDSNGYFDSTEAPQIITQTLPTGKSGVAHMILGQLNGATVPLVVRTGNVDTIVAGGRRRIRHRHARASHSARLGRLRWRLCRRGFELQLHRDADQRGHRHLRQSGNVERRGRLRPDLRSYGEPGASRCHRYDDQRRQRYRLCDRCGRPVRDPIEGEENNGVASTSAIQVQRKRRTSASAPTSTSNETIRSRDGRQEPAIDNENTLEGAV